MSSSTQKLYINKGLFHLSDELVALSPKKILLITGKKSFQSVKEQISPTLQSYCTIHFSDFEKNPQMEDIQTVIKIILNKKIDLVLAVGGGSSIDVAKAAVILSSQNERETSDIQSFITGKTKLEARKIPLFVIPTTAGSGSESTHFSVIYINQDKYSMAHPSMQPDVAIVDSSLLDGIPESIALASGLDALCQGIESYWSSGGTETSRQYALEALELISPYWQDTFTYDQTFYQNFVKASNLAGKAINISKTTASHALSYYLTINYNVPHGIAVALTIGVVSQLTWQKADDETKKRLCTIFEKINIDPNKNIAQQWQKKLQQLNVKVKLQQYGLPVESIASMIDSVNLERLSNHPVTLLKEELTELLESIY